MMDCEEKKEEMIDELEKEKQMGEDIQPAAQVIEQPSLLGRFVSGIKYWFGGKPSSSDEEEENETPPSEKTDMEVPK